MGEITESIRRDAMDKIDIMRNYIAPLKSIEDSEMDYIMSLGEPEKILKAPKKSKDAEYDELVGSESVKIVIGRAKKEAEVLETLIEEFEEELDDKERYSDRLMEQCTENIEVELEKLPVLEAEKMINEEQADVRIEKVGEIP